MTGRPVREGALFYAETKRRLAVPFGDALRRLTEAAALEFGELFAAGRAPGAIWRADRCRAYSLIELLPAENHGKSAIAFSARAITAAPDEAAGGDTGGEVKKS
jgi:CRISPR-associated exonuclease Cas4